MTQQPSYRLDALSERVYAELVGDGSLSITGLSSLADAGPSDLSFYADPRYKSALESTRAGAILTKSPIDGVTTPLLLHADPFLAFIELVDVFYPLARHEPGVSPLAHVAPDARIAGSATVYPYAVIGAGGRVGAQSVVHPGVVIGDDVEIGSGCVLWPRVVVREGCRLGDRVVVHAGAVIGADGFGFARRDGEFTKVRHVGTVCIEDDVEIGANATIDRGTLGRTLIRKGVKIDNLVHIAHNVQIGENSAMAAQAGISGSTEIGTRVLIGGQVGMVDHLSIGDDAVLIAQSGVIGDIAPGTMVSGYPARPHREVLRANAELRHLTELRHRVRKLEARIEELTGTTDDEG